MKTIFMFLFILTTHYTKSFAQINNSVMEISDIEIKNGWITLFDSNSKKISQMPQLKNEIVGIAGNFFVVTNNGWIITYDERCKKIEQMAQSGKQVKAAVGSTFTVFSNGWIITYDKKCKEKSKRPK